MASFLTLPMALPIPLLLYLSIEILLIPLFFVLRAKLAPVREPPKFSDNERTRLWSSLLAELDRLDDFLPTWFTYSGTGRGNPGYDELLEGNAVEFLAWAFFHKTLPGRPHSNYGASELDEIELRQVRSMLSEALNKHGMEKLPPGYNERLRCSRLTMDEMKAVHRPWGVYAVTHTLGGLYELYLERSLGFRRKKLGRVRYLVYHPMGRQQSDSKNQMNDFNKQSDDPKNRDSQKSKEPIVFIHGIGIGLAPYHAFLVSLRKSHPTRSIVLILLPHVSMRLHMDIPAPREFVASLSDILATERIQKAVWIAHSLGTTCFAWISRYAPQLISRGVLVDPVCFALWDGSVAHNFVYSERFANRTDRIVRYACGRELFAAHALARHFVWHENLLLATELPGGVPITAFVASEDAIANPQRTRKWCAKYGVEVEWMQGVGHAGWLVSSGWREGLVGLV